MSSYTRNIMVGLTVLVAAGVFVWMLLMFGGHAIGALATPQIPIQFRGERADGISDGSAITYRGVQIGRVISVARTPDGNGVLIDASVDRDPPLPANLNAEIVQSSLLGAASDISLDIPEGQSPQGKLSAGTTLDVKFVGLKLNLLPPEISDAARQLGQVGNELAEEVKIWHDSDATENLNQTIQSFNAQVKSVGDKYGQLADSARTVIPEFHNTLDILNRSTTRISQEADGLNDKAQLNLDNLNSTISDSRNHIDELNKQLGDRLTQISSVLASIQSIAQKIDQGKGTAGMLVNDQRLYQALVDVADEMKLAVTDGRRLIDQWENEGLSIKTK